MTMASSGCGNLQLAGNVLEFVPQPATVLKAKQEEERLLLQSILIFRFFPLHYFKDVQYQ